MTQPSRLAFVALAFFALSNALNVTVLPTKPIEGLIHQDFAYKFDAVHRFANAYHTFYFEPSDLLSQYQFHVSIERGEEMVCSGALITGGQHVITAASCGATSTDVVRIHSPKILNNGRIVRVTCARQHPNYRQNTGEYDIAVLILSEKIQGILLFLNSPGAIPSAAQVTSYTSFAKREYQNSLVVTDTPVVPQTSCQQYGFDLTNTMLCAGHFALNTSWCSADRGSPLFAEGKLIGVKSWGQHCARIMMPSVYTNVAAVQDWIWKTVEDLWEHPAC